VQGDSQEEFLETLGLQADLIEKVIHDLFFRIDIFTKHTGNRALQHGNPT
jgi:hypothetical protein